MNEFNLNDRRFVTAANNSGLSSNETVFHYRQEGEIITATYQGGHILQGHILGKQTGPNTIELLYNCITSENELMAGESQGVLSMNDGKVQINFDWNWLNGDKSGGKSEYIEIISEA